MSKYTHLSQAIHDLRPSMTFHHPQDKGYTIGLPHPFVAPTPASGIFKGDQFYRDSFFISIGLAREGQRSLIKGMIDNFLMLFSRFGLIPSRNRFYNVGISQPPLLTSMIALIPQDQASPEWLEQAYTLAYHELTQYWMDQSGHAEIHTLFQGLARYCDHNITHTTSEHESGRDMTSRFDNRCMDMLPIDLNCMLYTYEIDLATYFQNTGKETLAQQLTQQAQQRKEAIQSLMRDAVDGCFYDYDIFHEQCHRFVSAASFWPLRAGVATHQQAQQLVEKLQQLLGKGGIMNTQIHDLDVQINRSYLALGIPALKGRGINGAYV